MVVKQPQFTRVEEPTLLCNQVGTMMCLCEICSNSYMSRGSHGWHEDDGRSTILNCMVRTKALILILALIVTPVASLCATQSGMPAQCPRFCPMHGKMATHTSAGESDEMDCHHGKSPDCVMKGCGHAGDFGLASPLPPAVLCPQLKLIAIRKNGAVRLANRISSLVGFNSPPVQPPRA
jgi:hypothetical protein